MEDSSHSSFAMLSSDHGHQNNFLERSPFERNIESGNREDLLLVYLTAFLLMFQSQRESSIHFWLMRNTEHRHHEYFLRHKKSKVTEKKVTMEGTEMGRQVLFQGINRKRIFSHRNHEADTKLIKPYQTLYSDTKWRKERPFLISIKAFFIYQALHDRVASTLNGHHSFLT